ncbi:hypothetical protein XELAEV_18042101mg [Xenopus laevis]|uniref:Secreted protein n=1 Tax=Xenopus laevis TaxID=8355 RepID=A0A974H676_XENLA|nr:hypothetical protein XELAEV_18042101mg [Xenopus laevis]
MVHSHLLMLICITAIFLIKIPQNVIEFLQISLAKVKPLGTSLTLFCLVLQRAHQPPAPSQFTRYHISMHLCVGDLHE